MFAVAAPAVLASHQQASHARLPPYRQSVHPLPTTVVAGVLVAPPILLAGVPVGFAVLVTLPAVAAATAAFLFGLPTAPRTRDTRVVAQLAVAEAGPIGFYGLPTSAGVPLLRSPS